jgi:hypothetical protein
MEPQDPGAGASTGTVSVEVGELETAGTEEAAGDGSLAAAEIVIGGRRHRVWYRFPRGPVAGGAEGWLAAALPLAMRTAAHLRIPGALSARLWEAVPGIQALYAGWNPSWRPVPVTAGEIRPAAPSPGAGAAAFFTGGVDSFFTLLRRQGEIDMLVFVHGFDIPIGDEPARRTVAAPLRRAAEAFAKPLLEVETNLRDVSDLYVPWEMYHGAALASVALLLAPRWSRIFIAASDSYLTLVPWGSHPDLDPRWSTEAVEVIHDGCDASRVAKVARVAESDAALGALRVCWERPGAYNCGVCEKCLRTMVALRIAGALGRCPTFARPLDLRAVARMRVPHTRMQTIEALQAVEASGSDPALARALRDCLSGRYDRGLWGAARRIRGRWRRFGRRRTE